VVYTLSTKKKIRKFINQQFQIKTFESAITHLLLAVEVKSPVTLSTGTLVIGQFPCFFITGDVVGTVAQNTPQFGRFILCQFLTHNLFRL
jgi:hypothetical protein